MAGDTQVQMIPRSQSQGSAHLRRDHEAALLSTYDGGLQLKDVADVRDA